MKGGFIVSPFNPRMQSQELEYIINDSQVKALFVGAELNRDDRTIENPVFPRLRNIYLSKEKPLECITMMSFSGPFPKKTCCSSRGVRPLHYFSIPSGTTGVPRGAVYTHYCKLEEARQRHLPSAFSPITNIS